MLGSSDGSDSKRTKQFILLLALLVALIGSITYSVVQGRKYAVKVRPNSPFNLVVTWRCLACGHTLDDNAAVGPRECPQCGQAEMYVRINHACGRHGVFPVAFQYTEDGDPVEVKVADDPWVPRLTEEGGINIRCPKCNAIMIPAESPKPRGAPRPRRGD